LSPSKLQQPVTCACLAASACPSTLTSFCSCCRCMHQEVSAEAWSCKAPNAVRETRAYAAPQTSASPARPARRLLQTYGLLPPGQHCAWRLPAPALAACGQTPKLAALTRPVQCTYDFLNVAGSMLCLCGDSLCPTKQPEMLIMLGLMHIEQCIFCKSPCWHGRSCP